MQQSHAKCLYARCRSAGGRYAECRNVECRGALPTLKPSFIGIHACTLLIYYALHEGTEFQ
jgi:hypothetical protein